MLTPLTSYYHVDLSIKADMADIADGSVVIVGGICPFAGTIKEVWLGVGSALPTSATCAVAKSATTDVEIVAAVTLQTALTVNVAATQTLTTNTNDLHVTAGTMLEATWTLTNITEASDATHCCLVVLEPDTH